MWKVGRWTGFQWYGARYATWPKKTNYYYEAPGKDNGAHVKEEIVDHFEILGHQDLVKHERWREDNCDVLYDQ